MSVHYTDATVTIHHGDCLDVLRTMEDASVDAVVTDPPYGLEFMGKEWDAPWKHEARAASAVVVEADQVGGFQDGSGGNAFSRSRVRTNTQRHGGDVNVANRGFQDWCESWSRECLRVLKPGGHMLTFGGTRTWHRLACAVEDAGFEVRDSIAWMYGSGFPKSLDVSKAIDKAARGVPQGGVDPTSPNHGKYRTTTTEGKRWDGDSGQGYGAGGSRFLADGMASGSGTEHAASGVAAIASEAESWQGWGTALKPAFEPIVVARKPLAGTVAANVLAHGTGALNVDGCRVEHASEADRAESVNKNRHAEFGTKPGQNQVYGDYSTTEVKDYDGSKGRWPANVVLDEESARVLDEQSGESTSGAAGSKGSSGFVDGYDGDYSVPYGDTGGASRFFYVAKAGADERVRVNGTAHPTVKPLALMRWLVRLVTPPQGTVLEPFAGSGTTVEACILEGFRCVAIEREADYLPLIVQRVNRRRDPVAAVRATESDGGLFDLLGGLS